MSDAFRETSAQEAQMAVLQFMGQHLTGDLKELEKSMVSTNTTLAGMTLRPDDIIRSIGAAGLPQQAPPPQIAVQPNPVPVSIQPELAIAPVSTPQVSLTEAQAPITDQDQLEFNFNSSPYTERVFSKIESIEQAIRTLGETQQEILLAIKTISPSRTKKKDC
jgi:hypothetical protein